MGALVKFKKNMGICLERDRETLEIIVCAIIISKKDGNVSDLDRQVDLLLELRGFPEIGDYMFLSSNYHPFKLRTGLNLEIIKPSNPLYEPNRIYIEFPRDYLFKVKRYDS